MSDSDRHLVCDSLALCPLVDDPEAGIAKIRDVLNRRPLRGYELREIVTSLGESRSDAAVDLLYELASDAQTFEQCEEYFVNAFATLDTPHARELLLGFVEPAIHTIAVPQHPHGEDRLVARLADLAQRNPEMAARLRKLCERNRAAINRHILSKVMARLGTPEALVANMNLIDDSAKPVNSARRLRSSSESAFVERQPYEEHPNTFDVTTTSVKRFACTACSGCLSRTA